MDFEGTVNVKNNADKKVTLVLNGDRGDLLVGGNGQDGSLTVLDSKGKNRLTMEPIANGGRIRMLGSAGESLVELVGALNAVVIALGGSGFDGNIRLKDASGKETVLISGRDGDISLDGADAAESFAVADGFEDVTGPGTVMVIGQDGRLRPSYCSYDTKVAGVVSGAGELRPGLILGRNEPHKNNLPIALAGKVYCQVEADENAIAIGDLLTSSNVPGHAMKAADSQRFGCVMGKALEELGSGRSLIPILVSLQ